MPSFDHFRLVAALLFVTFFLVSPTPHNRLSPTFYDETCPNVIIIIREIIQDTLRSDPRIAASLIRLHFHDCFVNVCYDNSMGCDGSVLLDSSFRIESEKESIPNKRSIRGFKIIDRMKSELEYVCPGTVSCADILTIAAEESVYLSGGPPWENLLGRRDCISTNTTLANLALPSPFGTFDELKARFSVVGLNKRRDLVALSGAHTLGKARCANLFHRLYNFNNTSTPDPRLDKTYLQKLQKLCPLHGDPNVLVDFDYKTPYFFDKNYFKYLRRGKGLLQSDQELISTKGAKTIELIKKYSKSSKAFFRSFVKSMIKMGNIGVLTATQGEIRLNCRMINEDYYSSQSSNSIRVMAQP